MIDMMEPLDLTGLDDTSFGPQDIPSSTDTHTELLFQILEKVTVLQYQIEQMQKKERSESDVTDPERQSPMLDFAPFDPFDPITYGGL